jgi:glutamate dehydrogenase (NAD(P)+)
MPINSLQLDFHDEFGPHKVIRVYEPKLDLYGALVVDNIAAGPSIGGLRMAPDVTIGECFRLARAMTLKNAAAGLPHGGGKSVLASDPRMPAGQKEARIRAFACALASEEGYIFGPDMGTDEQCMAWVRDEIGRAVGLPRVIGGIPLDELGATGFGLMHSIQAALPFIGLTLDGARMAVQGFGSVGMHAARFLAEKGTILVAASDSDGAVANPGGLDVAALIAHKRAGGSVSTFAGGQACERDAIIAVECDIWIPAARPDVVTIDNVDQLQTRIVAQGANIPLTEAAEKRLHERGVLCLPDFIANAGGVICAAMEYHGVGETAAFAEIADRIAHNTDEMLSRSKADNTTPRQAALDMAIVRLRAAMSTRRWSIF